jgi:hypothetical protein
MLTKSPRLRLCVLLFAVVSVVAVTVVVAQTAPAPETPPGIAAENWVALNDHSGLLIVNQASAKPVVAQLWVKLGGRWQQVLLQAPANSVIPAR